MAGERQPVDLRDLRSFVAVAETRNLSRAAGQLRVAQPALSRQIQELERELGTTLLDRRPTGAIPTMAGAAFAKSARDVLAEIGAALDRAHATAEGRRGRVVMGAMRAIILGGFVAQVQDLLRREHPEIALVVQDYDTPEVWDRLRSGQADVALAVQPNDANLIAEPLWVDQADRAIVPAGHPIAKRPRVTVPDLGPLPLIVSPRAVPPALFDNAIAVLRKAGLRSPILAFDGDLRAAHLAVGAGRGWTLISRARAIQAPDGAVVIPVDGIDVPILSSVLYRRGERRPVVRTVVEAVFAAARQVPDHRVRPDPALPAATSPPTRKRREPGTVPATIELRHLRALLGVAATQTIGRAAERLGVTQPALSRQLRELEHALGVSLLERSARGVALTPAGAALAGDCPALLLGVEHLAQEIRRAKRGMEGRCVIAAVATAASSALLTRVLALCSAKNPHLQVVIEEMPSPLQPAALLRSEIDLGLAHAYPTLADKESSALIKERVQEDRLDCALVGSTHSLAQRKWLGADDLKDVPFLFMARPFHPLFYDRVMAALEALNLVPRVEATYDGLQTVWALAAQGQGWCLGFRSHLKGPPSGTAAVRIKGLDLPWGMDLLRRRTEHSPTVRSVIEQFLKARQVRGVARRPR